MAKKIDKRDIVVRALSFLIAVGLWIYVSYVENPEIEVWFDDIPITYTNSEMLANQKLIRNVENEIKDISLKVRGSRGAMLAMSSRDISARVDLSGITSASTYSLPILINFPVDGFTVTDRKPYNISVTVEDLTSKELPLYVELAGTPDPSCTVSQVLPSLSSITVKGAASWLKDAESCVAKTNIEGLSSQKEITADIKLRLSDGTIAEDTPMIEFSSKTVSVMVDVNIKKNIAVRAAFENKDEVSVKDVKINPSEIEISGDYKTVSALTEIETEPIALERKNELETVDAALALPEGIKTVGDVKTVKVEVTIEKESVLQDG